MDGWGDTNREAARQTGKSFDPRPHLRRVQSQGQESDYLDVKWRLAWLRAEYPDARITTELATLNESLAIFRATVEIPNGGSATGYGSEVKADFPDYIEKAETRAVGRALAALGYGTQFALELDHGNPVLDLDLPSGASADSSARPQARPPLRLAPRPEPEPEPEPTVEQEVEQPRMPVKQAVKSSAPAAPEVSPDEGYDPANFKWNEFWHWARGLGYSSKSQVEGLLGHPFGEMTPREVRAELIAYRREQGLQE